MIQVRPKLLFTAALLVQLVCAAFGNWESESRPQSEQPPLARARFHHLHLNTVDPKRAVEFYSSKFDCEKAAHLGEPAIWAQKSWILFNKVRQDPPWELVSAVWHFGWGAEDMKTTYQKHVEMGTKFFTPLTDISDIGGGTATGRFFYAYVESPDRALIELNTASHHHFGHLHLFSADPVSAGEWYMKHFGLQRRGTRPPSREPRFYRGHQIGPSMSLMMDNVNVIIYPIEYPKKAYAAHWNGRERFASTKGRAVDHVAFSVDNLAETIERLAREGVKIVEPIRAAAGGKLKHAFIEGPDQILIELVEGHASKEPS
ncbi:MAG TPA: VOC family protein [Blastocatellia bacterium]|jgi:catechol 2,3-dioxygenase-like lactoylglutathione lyase family enzyme